MDLNFATGLHNLVNAVLFLLVQIPDMTYLRCLRYCGEGQLKCEPRPGALLRLPGGGPDVAGHACRQLAGRDLRGATPLVVQGFLGWATPSCYPLSLGQHLARRHALRRAADRRGGKLEMLLLRYTVSSHRQLSTN